MQKNIFKVCAYVSIIIMSSTTILQAADHNFSVDSGFIEVDGGRIFYEAAGNGPVIVMTHDGILHRETWDGQFMAFADSHRVIRWDRRGYGRSDKAEEAFSNVEDLYTLMKALKVKKATLMGCSSGSLLCIYFAEEYPEMVSSLILVGPIVSGFSFTSHVSTRGDQNMPGRDAPLEKRIEYWVWHDPWQTFRENKKAKEKIEKLLKQNPQNMERPARYARWPDFHALDRLPEIKVPTLIIAGEWDIPDVHTHIGVIEYNIKGSGRVLLTGAGHLVHFEVPDKFNPVVRDFLGKL